MTRKLKEWMPPTGDELPSNESVLRYIYGDYCQRDSNGDYFALPGAFFPRINPPLNETALSVTRIDYFTGNKNEKLLQASNSLYSALVRGRRNKKTNINTLTLFAIIKISDIKNICNEFGVNVKIFHTKTRHNKAHATIYFLKNNVNIYENLDKSNSNQYENILKMNKAIVNSQNIKYKTLKEIINIK